MQAQEYRINWEIYTPHAGAAGMLYPYFWHFTLWVCLFCSRIVDNVMEFDATVIQVKGLASYKTRFNPPFSTSKNACTKSGIWQLLSIRLMCLDFWVCLLILDFPFWIFLGVQCFCVFTFCYLEMESSQLESWNHLSCREIFFSIDPHCQFLDVGQDMRPT